MRNDVAAWNARAAGFCPASTGPDAEPRPSAPAPRDRNTAKAKAERRRRANDHISRSELFNLQPIRPLR